MIISFSSLGSHGRLGNQLFQVMSTLGLAEKHSSQAAFPEWEYEKYFVNYLPKREMQKNRIEEREFHHYDWHLRGSCDIYGYLQSEKYFGSEKLEFKPGLLKDLKSKYEIFDKKTICIHIRRGDYVDNPNYVHLSVEYYIDALLTHFPNWKDYNILFVSDDIEYCRVHFECMPNAYFSKETVDIMDIALASCCDHFIISNSSFGWWCAWFGEKKNSKIIHCGCLHDGPLANKDTRDYWPDRWTEHRKDKYRIPLKDVTFTIPVFLDHTDRKHNLDLSMKFLRRSFDTNVMVCEQGRGSFQYVERWAEFFTFPGNLFHRTRMLNLMAVKSHTPFIVNWDCDIVLPPMQILVAVEELRGGADMMLPYGGGFPRMPRDPWLARLAKYMDIGIVGNSSFNGREAGHNSVGGAVMFNKKSFIKGGMENENFISFGPEDIERNERFRRLGFKVKRVQGCLFHIDHFVGPNSSKKNPYFTANHAELNKGRGMTDEELGVYVDSWAWKKAAQKV